ncbi:tumor necrosis factor (ligand) superfamily, member 10 like 4 [Hoplias malabaricus]|uniref:tumor necrosis factor (ligand) superfamily, member 10 like 4 n=1 Tax=Hoplias malabaricus TaxID=27720 RepID=UPI0034623A2B
MTGSDTESECVFSVEKEKSEHSGRWSILFLLLSLVLAAETFFTICFLYDFSSDLHGTNESLRQGFFPMECLHQFLDGDEGKEEFNGGGMDSCEIMKREFEHSAQQRILLDIQNSLWLTLGDHNVTQIFKPAVHLGAKQKLKQYQHLQDTGDPEAVSLGVARLNWEAESGQSWREGLMGFSPEGEIVVPLDGIYFVYSQVYFESAALGRDLRFVQYLFKRSALRPEPAILSRSTATRCVDSGSGVELYSSHQGALFHLQRGDRLALYVLNLDNVRFPPESTYFGAFIID